MTRRVLAVLGVLCAVVLAGCPTATNPGGTVDLTIGGDPATGYLKTGGVNWYRFEITEDYVGERVDVILRNVNQVPVGVIMRLFCSGDRKRGELSLEWEEIIPPTNTYVQLTDESLQVELVKSGAEKARQINGFLIPRAGFYYISVEGYQFLDGKRPANDYQYRDTLAYTLGVRFTPKPGIADAAPIIPQPQAAGVPFVTGYLRPGDTVFHPAALETGVVYQAQVFNEGAVPFLTRLLYRDQTLALGVMETTQPALNQFFTLGRPDTYYLSVTNPAPEDFGYSGYSARIYIDDHGMDPQTATPLPLATANHAGYLTNGDRDWFSLTFPANTGTTYRKYTVQVSTSAALRLVGSGTLLSYDASTGVYSMEVTRPPASPAFPGNTFSSQDWTHVFSLEEIDPSGLTEGFGEYTLGVGVTVSEFSLPAPQSATAPVVSGFIPADGQALYFPLSLAVGNAYQMLVRVAGPSYAVVDSGGNALGMTDGYFRVPSGGDYFLRIAGAPLAPFAVRLMRDDHGMDFATASLLPVATATHGGYLSVVDTDWFYLSFPSNAGTQYLQYSVDISVSSDLSISGDPVLVSLGSDTAVYNLTVTRPPASVAFPGDTSASLPELHLFTLKERTPAPGEYGDYGVSVSVTQTVLAIPSPQSASAPFLYGFNPSTAPQVYLPLTLAAGTAYQMQAAANDASYAVVNSGGTVLRAGNGYFTVAAAGDYFLRTTESPYAVRVMTDDNGMNAATATRITPDSGTQSGYLGAADTDWFSFVFPENTGAAAVTYSLEIAPNNASGLTLSGGGLAYNAGGGVYTLTFTQNPGAAEAVRTFSVTAAAPVQDPNGYGGYALAVTRL